MTTVIITATPKLHRDLDVEGLHLYPGGRGSKALGPTPGDRLPDSWRWLLTHHEALRECCDACAEMPHKARARWQGYLANIVASHSLIDREARSLRFVARSHVVDGRDTVIGGALTVRMADIQAAFTAITGRRGSRPPQGPRDARVVACGPRPKLVG